MRRSGWLQNAAATLIGLLLAVALVVGIDRLFAWRMDISLGSAPAFFPDADAPHGLGWVPKRDAQRRKRERDGKVVFDVTYHFDEFRRRVTPAPPKAAVDEFVIFFGGSQTFGLGLADDQTIPALVQRAVRTRRVYNYAYGGYGPNQMLRLLEAGQLPGEVTELRGTAFYQFISPHVFRVIGSLRIVTWAGGRHPYYRLNRHDELEYAGSFATGRPITTALYWILSRSALVRHFEVDLPHRLREEHYELTCRVVMKSQELFLSQFPGSRFVVVVALTVKADDPFVTTCLDAEGIEYVDLRPEYREGITLDGDPHLSPLGARITAEKIVRALPDASP
jgi:hypothetical protein